MQCVILAGGLGTRMLPFTESIPKALIPAAGQPFISHQLSYLKSQGIGEVVLSIGYRGEMIRDFVKDGSSWGLKVEFVDEGKELKGTGGALRLAFEQQKLEETFLVLYGDSYLPIDFQKVWNAFDRIHCPALMTVMKNEGRWDSSNAILKDDKVTLYQKNKSPSAAGTLEYIDYGLSVINRKLIETEIQPGHKADLSDLYHKLSLEGRLAGLEVFHRFYEVGSPSGLQEFEDYLKKCGSEHAQNSKSNKSKRAD